jgi:hypothetical protein
MQTPATSSRTMALNSDTRENIITWFTKEFGFSCNAATALHDVQALKDAQALSELDDNDAVANVCKAVGKDVGQSVAKIAVTLDQTPVPDLERDQGDPKTNCKDRIQW